MALQGTFDLNKDMFEGGQSVSDQKNKYFIEIGFKAIVKVTPNTSQEQFKNEPTNIYDR